MESFENAIKQWYDLCKAKAEGALLLLVGNKTDLEMVVPESSIK